MMDQLFLSPDAGTKGFVSVCVCQKAGKRKLGMTPPNLLSIQKSESEAAQSCLTLCDTGDCSPPGSSIHRLLQASILEWVAISFSRGSFWPRDQTHASCIGKCVFLISDPPGKPFPKYKYKANFFGFLEHKIIQIMIGFFLCNYWKGLGVKIKPQVVNSLTNGFLGYHWSAF